MVIIAIRTIILYFVVLCAIRIMGKSELSKITPFQMVIIFMIAELASMPIESTYISLINGVTAIFILLFLQVSISLLSLKFPRFKVFIDGTPTVLINKGEINIAEMRSLRISIDSLMEQLRIGNYPSISDIEYAILETNGELSIMPKSDKSPLTPSDMKITTSSKEMPLVLISDGFLYTGNIEAAGYNINSLKSALLPYGITSEKNVFLAFSDENRNLHVYPKNNKSSKEVLKN